MADINTMIQWMADRQGKVKYSMTSRLGPNSYDCSSTVYNALIAGGFLPQGTIIGNTETLFNDLERTGWSKVPLVNGNYAVKRGDIFIWGTRGQTLGAAGHTGIFTDNADNMIHCNFGYNGITVNNHDVIWAYNGRPNVTVYRYIGGGSTQSKPSVTKPQPSKPTGLISHKGTFYPNQKLPVSADTNPDDKASPAVAYYNKDQAIDYDSYIASNGYMWISYIGGSGNRRYIAVGTDDGQTDTTWGRGFFN